MQNFETNIVSRGIGFKQHTEDEASLYARNENKGFWPLIKTGVMQKPHDWLNSQP